MSVDVDEDVRNHIQIDDAESHDCVLECEWIESSPKERVLGMVE